MAAKICTFVGIILLITSAVISPIKLDKASANGATRIIVDDVQEGPFLFRVGVLPGSPKVGNLHLSILIQAADGDKIIEDGRITVRATGPEPGMIAGPVQATNDPLYPQVFSADITMTDLGAWSMTLETVSSLGAATLVVPLQVTESSGLNLMIIIVIAVAIVCMTALAWSQIQQKRQQT